MSDDKQDSPMANKTKLIFGQSWHSRNKHGAVHGTVRLTDEDLRKMTGRRFGQSDPESADATDKDAEKDREAVIFGDK